MIGRRAPRIAQAAGLVARDQRIPRWLRGLLLFGALPIPGPVDNVAAVVGLVILWARHRSVVLEHWTVTATVPLVAADTWGAWS